MNDQNDQSKQAQTVVPAQDNNQPLNPPVVPVAEDANKDLQSLSKDLENLAQEAVKTVPEAPVVTPAAPVVETPAPVEAPAPAVVAAPAVEEKKASDAKITIYTTTNCPFCKTEKEFLTTQGLTFSEKNVEEDNEALKEMLSLSDNFAGVPVTVLNGPKGKKVVKGFTQDEFVKELEATGLKEAVVAPAPVPEAPVPPTEVPAQPTDAPKVPDLQ
ncbi:hypothetical protein A2313_02780 [Candidatus Roizmanbacteria bacterium RIFOXYB2_FULL_41_10]|nr:MAG: hypothetical protein A2377_02475 [Candidatus Roizmanbacteria bacterium RIFOXYB1_FULL_41_27]OGK67216.1 MAG: hypothetical protein A2262_03205 [Candidatus Roizmanbacteria bacterium RIFOXYA2_FULL_41_8]OGK70661.1 MAG: hypothetical protein A2313_02780 [Candidatus Roizmanbacteria bacterium RIFOXYB2_FULL_41_10]OGK75134.1 MAG: hypothetical protein A2459_01955 [Candidatus Roizmanbacteria bacterium RIFOXYC2_FULL_41_10]OGK75543.1 MAG: hypothetical protein A2575_02465 [Candidatus Roizmanbacteria bac